MRPSTRLAGALGVFVLAGTARASEPANVASGRIVVLEAAQGDGATATDGRLLPEGGPLEGDAVVFQGEGSSLVVDLGHVQPIGALLLQASAADVYFVEVSTDGAAWEVAWRVPPLQSAPLWRTRTVVLAGTRPARWLRVRPTTARTPAVAELQVFPGKPAQWPALERGLPTSPVPRRPGLTPERTALLMTATATLFLVAAAVHGGRRSQKPGRVSRGALLASAGLALLAWPNFLDFHRYTVVHKWDVFHYYAGGKYLPELGYTRLYACAAVVDAEDGVDLGGQTMRDLRDNTAVPVESELARAAECHARFSPRRWEGFRHDVRFFREAMGPRRFASLRIDHGFNGTPAWAVLGGLLARLSPASWTQMHLLVLVDFALLGGLLVMLARTFGLESAALAAGFFGVNALAPFGWTGGAFLRYDWLFCLAAGIAALKTRRPALAGFALAAAALLRVFPVFAIVGVLVKAAAEGVASRSTRPLRRQAPLAAGAALATTLFLAASLLMGLGPALWGEFLDNSAKHATTPMSNTVGLAVVLAYDTDARLETLADPLLPNRFALWEQHVLARERRRRPWQWLTAALFAALLLRAVRRAPAWAAAVLGLGLVPVSLKLSSYYSSSLMLYATLATLSPVAGAALAALAWITNVLHGLWSFPDDQYFALSAAVLAFVVAVTAVIARGSPSAPAEGDRAD